MNNPLGEAALIFLSSAGLCIIIGKGAIKVLARAQYLQPDRYEDCPPLALYQQTKRNVPTMGGLVVLGVAIIVAALSGGLIHPSGWAILGSIVSLGAIGWTDDFLKCRTQKGMGLRPWPKMLLALAVGAGFGLYMVVSHEPSANSLEIPVLHRSLELGWLWIPFAMLVMAGCAHAVNLTDGMDGLAAGGSAIALSIFGLLAMHAKAPDPSTALWSVSLAGACTGFLWFNSFPASVFLGDVGALGLGAGLASVALVSRKALWLLIIGAVFVAEALSVMLQVASYKWRGKRRIFRVAPLHHHFHLGGLSEPKLIVRFWIVGLLLAIGGLLL